MGKLTRNLLVSAFAFLLVLVCLPLAESASHDAFVANRIFRVYFDLIAANTLIDWALLFIVFLTVGMGIQALLRTGRPVVWACCFGAAYSLWVFLTRTNLILHPEPHLYVDLIGGYLMPVLACALGAVLGKKLTGGEASKAI